MEKLVQKGLTWLNDLPALHDEMEICRRDLMMLTENLSSVHDLFSWLSVIQSLIASSKNTFGVGAVIVDQHGDLIVEGQNQVFNPYFRSDLHAEMVVLNNLENLRQSDEPPVHYSLYTSLEPCMMCLGRCIISRIGHVYFVAKDPHGGVIHHSHLPFTFANLIEQQVIQEAVCHSTLKKISAKVIGFSVQRLVDKLGGTVDVMQA